ncbi:hypothetical protein QBC40DRAFT_63823 [Triangularia verruculosa]|uniref:Fungal N-terminal domain-containing protein n=1 Tax=Triangularia verruculosa TaxID=2587418 RepID=A0AAN7AW11_9PEZI|nr:hypothetical protein QBC40DRAFT_63823 [Triangularia verruculosa]
MEVIAAGASFVAIGQALGAVPKMVEMLRSVKEARSDLGLLLNELETLRATHVEMEALKRRLDPPPEPSNLQTSGVKEESIILSAEMARSFDTAAHELETLLSELDGLYKSCAVGADIRRIKWIWNKKKVTQLCERARSIRLHIRMVISDISVKEAHDTCHKMRLEIQSLFIQNQFVAAQTQFSIVHNQSGIAKLQTSLDSISAVISERATATDRDVYSTSAEATVIELERKEISKEDAHDTSIAVSVAIPIECREDCHCRCHTSKRQTRSPSWLTPIIGSWMLEYDITLITKPLRCDTSECQRSGPSTKLEYDFPSWLYHAHCAFGLSVGSMTGYGAYLRLFVPRYAPYHTNVWAFIRGRIRFDQLKIHADTGGMYYPTDSVAYGHSLLALVFIYARSEDVKIMVSY